MTVSLTTLSYSHTYCNGAQHIDTQHNNSQCLIKTTLSIQILSIITLRIKHSVN
jgi:hypothetical protein